MVKFAGIQFESGDSVDENIRRARGLIEEAAAKKAKIVCLPEYFYSNQPLAYIRKNSKKISGKVVSALDRCALETRSVVIYNIPEYSGGAVSNTSVATSGSREFFRYSKRKLYMHAPFNERRYFAPGKESPVALVEGIMLGMAICFDLRFPELFRELAFAGAQAVVVPSAFNKAKLHHWRTLLAARAIENQFFVIGVNKAGKDASEEYGGHTMFVSPSGEVISESTGDGEEIIVADINPRRVSAVRKEVCYLDSAKE